jgi:hypothetical protein
MQNSQSPIEQNFDDNDAGLQPHRVNNRILVNYIKTFAYLFGRDERNLIWRMIRTDSSGNIKVTPGAQQQLIPNVSNPQLTSAAGTQVLKANPDRKAFLIWKGVVPATGKGNALFINYGTISLTNSIFLPAGWGYKDDTWNGDVFITPQVVNMQCSIIEYF